MSCHGRWLVDSGSSCGVLDPSSLLTSIPHSSTRHPKLCLISGVGLCICSHQMLDEASQETVRLRSCLQAEQSIIIVSGVNSVTWDGSQVGVVIVWLLPRSLLHLYPCTSCRQDKFWVKGFIDRCPPASSGSPAWLQEVALSSLHPSLVGISTRVTP